MLNGERGDGQKDVFCGFPAFGDVGAEDTAGQALKSVRAYCCTEDYCLFVFFHRQQSSQGGALERHAVHESVDQEDSQGNAYVPPTSPVVEPYQHQRRGLQNDVQAQEQLIPTLPKAAQGCKVDQFVGNESPDAQQNHLDKQELDQGNPYWPQNSIPNANHASRVQQCEQAHHFSQPPMENIQ